jgi:phosphatidylethanolamine/phosphatidyl-N-methylethanolamine N-methyltransferase
MTLNSTEEKPRSKVCCDKKSLGTDIPKLIREQIVYTREFLQSYTYTGTMWSSSRWAAEAMTAPMRENSGVGGPRNILEVGPGTGVITFKILQYMKPDDQLVICEINPRFMEELKRNLAANEFYTTHKDRVSFFCGPVQDLSEDKKFDIIVSAVPFLNFTIETTRAIFSKFHKLSLSHTELTYYEYIGMRRLSKFFKKSARRTRVLELESFLAECLPAPEVSRSRVWCNLLPINVYRLQPQEMDFSKQAAQR